MRPARLANARLWRSAFAVLAIYGLVLQAVFATAALGGAVAAASGGLSLTSVICGSDPGHADAAQGGKGQRPPGHCVCQGLCPQHGAAGIELAAEAAQWSRALRIVERLAPFALELPAKRPAVSEGMARAPPRNDASAT